MQQLGDRFIPNENYLQMAKNIMSSQPGMMSNNVRWSEGRAGMSDQALAFEKMKEQHWPNMGLQAAKSPNNSGSADSGKTDREQRDMGVRRDKNMDKNLRCEEMMPTLDYFVHGGYPYPNFNLQARRESPPDIMAAERCKQAFARGSHGFMPENARNMHPDLGKITAEQIEAIYKSQGMGINVTVSPPEYPDRAGMLPAGARTGLPSQHQQQRPSPQTDRPLSHHNEFNKGMPYMGMEDKLLRIADAEKSTRSDLKAGNPGVFPGVIRMPTSSQMQSVQGLALQQQQQSNARFSLDMMHQSGFGMDPRLFEQNRAFLNSTRNEQPSPGELNSQRFVGTPRSMDNAAQKKNLHVPSRPMALGKFAP